MKRRRPTPEPVIQKLAEANRLLGYGKTIEEVCRTLGITESTFHRWRNHFDIEMARGEAGKLLGSSPRCPRAVAMLEERFRISERRACR